MVFVWYDYCFASKDLTGMILIITGNHDRGTKVVTYDMYKPAINSNSLSSYTSYRKCAGTVMTS